MTLPHSLLSCPLPISLSLGLRQGVQASVLTQEENVRDKHSAGLFRGFLSSQEESPLQGSNNPFLPSHHQSQDQELGTVSMGTVTSSLQFRTTETCLHASLIRALPLVRSWGLQSLGVGSFGPLGIEKPAATLFRSRCISPYHAVLHTGGSRPRGLQVFSSGLTM